MVSPGATILLYSCKQKQSTLPIRKHLEEAVFASGHIEQETDLSGIRQSRRHDPFVCQSKKEFPWLAGSLIARIESDVQEQSVERCPGCVRRCGETTLPPIPPNC